ncbi:MAG: valine--tRNA ligase [Simkaniaceae bacterium]|nr:valine--tRNA ligase [Simkaniaceae bacterium]
MEKSYDHKGVEPKWQEIWEKGGHFKADPSSDKPGYCIILPPPNVTGVLHMGHALVDTIQDILARYKRMDGHEVLWLPGTDHAGISTQTVVERHLMATEGKRRSDYPREEFLKHVWAFKEENQEHIIRQLKMVGCSLDWSRLRFTMDEKSNHAVRSVFKKMYDDGLIYRGDYLVNWDPVTQTALADDEVEHEERDSSLWHLRYPVVGSDEHLIIATTRPETMLGDTAVAVAPKDERYVHLVGKKIRLPIVGREIPIIEDHHVDPEFGTGALKITPAHDFNDWEVGQRHNLEAINLMTPDGKIAEGEYAGLSMLDARKQIVERLRKEGHLEKVEPHKNRVGLSYRSKAVIEPYLSKQWFVKVTAFKEKLISAIADADIEMVPDYWKKTYFHWIENLRDWCISRQLWWGHRIPVWHHEDGRTLCSLEDMPQEVASEPEKWEQDHDVLDTWFSSALWPFSSLGWPEKTPELEKFYPTSVLVTGHDILFFWVARMIMMGQYVMGEKPFDATFIHGLIYGKSYWRESTDGHINYVPRTERIEYELGQKLPKDVKSKWEKMSKSKGNVIDPIEIIEMYGADAMRMALCASVSHARQIDLDRRRFEEYKNFSNKLWNAARFVMMNLEDLKEGEIDQSQLTLDDRWILSRLSKTISALRHNFDTYDFDDAANRIYTFFWDEFCAYYVECSKPHLKGPLRENKQRILLKVLSASIRLLHPIVPFITEEIYSSLPGVDTLCMNAPFPVAREVDEEAEREFEEAKELLYTVRNIRAEMGLAPNVAVDVHIVGESKHTEIVSALVRTKSIQMHSEEPKLTFASVAMAGPLKVLIPLPEDLIEKEKARLAKEREKLQAQIESFKVKLSNPNFVNRAPKALVEETRNKLAELEAQIAIN